jgi:hypothetical protein
MSAARSREIVVWIPPHERPEYLEEQARKKRQIEARDEATEARLAIAHDRKVHAQMMTRTRELVLHELEKLLRLAQQEDFRNAIGPVAVADLIKLAEMSAKDYRLSAGLSTENIAAIVAPSVDFSKMTQEERDLWRRLALKGGAQEE